MMGVRLCSAILPMRISTFALVCSHIARSALVIDLGVNAMFSCYRHPLWPLCMMVVLSLPPTRELLQVRALCMALASLVEHL